MNLLFHILIFSVLTFENISFAQTINEDSQRVLVDELQSIHGLNSRRIMQVFNGDKSHVLAAFREIYQNTDNYFPKLNSVSLGFIKNTIIANYCHFVSIEQGLTPIDSRFLNDTLDDANITDNDDQKISIYTCLKNLGSKAGLEKLQYYFSTEEKLYLKQQILDLSIQLLNTSPINQNRAGDQIYNYQVEFNLAERFFRRESGDWQSLILKLKNNNKWLEQKMLESYPGQKVIVDTYKTFDKNIDAALIDSKQIEEQSGRLNKAQDSNNSNTSNRPKISREPQSIENEEISSQDNLRTKFILMGLVLFFIGYFFYRASKKNS
jgi:hypothetical protein